MFDLGLNPPQSQKSKILPPHELTHRHPIHTSIQSPLTLTGNGKNTLTSGKLQFKPPQSLQLKNQSFFQFNNGRDLPLFNTITATSLQWEKIRTSRFCGRSSDLLNLNFCSFYPLQKTQKRNLVVAARRKSRRRTGWGRSGKSALESALLIASNLKLLPEPMNLIIREGLSGGGSGNGNGNGGGFGSWNGWFDGWGGNSRKRDLGFLRILLGFCALGLLIFKKEFEGFSDLGIGVLGLLLLGIAERDWKRGIKGWILGFCSCALMMFLVGFRREKMQKWVQRSRGRSPFKEILRREEELQRWVQGLKVRYPVMEFFKKRRRRVF